MNMETKYNPKGFTEMDVFKRLDEISHRMRIAGLSRSAGLVKRIAASAGLSHCIQKLQQLIFKTQRNNVPIEGEKYKNSNEVEKYFERIENLVSTVEEFMEYVLNGIPDEVIDEIENPQEIWDHIEQLDRNKEYVAKNLDKARKMNPMTQKALSDIDWYLDFVIYGMTDVLEIFKKAKGANPNADIDEDFWGDESFPEDIYGENAGGSEIVSMDKIQRFFEGKDAIEMAKNPLDVYFFNPKKHVKEFGDEDFEYLSLRARNAEYIELDNTAITRLDPIKNFKKPHLVSLDKTKISDLSPLSGEPIKIIFLTGCANVTDIEPLADVLGLETLYIQNSNVKSLEPLRNLKNLKNLTIVKTLVKDLSPLAEIDSLKKLTVESECDLTPLQDKIDSGKLKIEQI